MKIRVQVIQLVRKKEKLKERKPKIIQMRKIDTMTDISLKILNKKSM